jgi:uncharacterized membrane protein YvbJ
MTNYCERCGTEDIEDGEILCEECNKELDGEKKLTSKQEDLVLARENE